MCSNPEERARKFKEMTTVKDKSLMNGIDPKLEPIVSFSERVRDGHEKELKKQQQNRMKKLGGSQETQTPAPSPTEVGSLGGSTAVDRKNKKGISSMTTSNTILGSSKGG